MSHIAPDSQMQVVNMLVEQHEVNELEPLAAQPIALEVLDE